jgi:hypothetical protein
VALVIAVAASAPLLPWLARKREVAGGGTHAAPARLALRAIDALDVVAVVALLILSGAWLASGTYNPFIYFRF